jgi:copper chaperone CopZ
MKWLLLPLFVLLLAACGRDAAPRVTETAQYSISGMTCENCVQGILFTLERVDGFNAATIDLETESAQIQFDPSKITAADFAERISNSGFPTRLLSGDQDVTVDET